MTQTDRRRAVPRTDAVLADPRVAAAGAHLRRSRVRAVVSSVLDAVRAGHLMPADVVDRVVAELPRAATTLRPVINATGVVLHTNLGRAQLSEAARDAMSIAAGAVDVEYDLQTGQRARRGRATLAALRRAVPDAEAVLVVNNGAAALVLATTTLAAGREVIVSRGELVEIGDGFRLPDLITSTGARLREVGTTNRVRVADYATALGPDTGCVLKVHPSNFRIEGFTASVAVRDLASLAVPLIVDVGSGLLAPDPLLPDEPDVANALNSGATLVTCSGDKLLGGPQAGLIFGTGDAIDALRRHPLARALRVDKLTLAALEATLDGPATPTHEALHAEPETLRERCTELAASLSSAVGALVMSSDGIVGGGGAPGLRLPGWAVALPPDFARPLRLGDPAVVGRVERDHCLIDLRCVPPGDDVAVRRAIEAVAGARS